MLTRNFFRLVCVAVVVIVLLFALAMPNRATNVAAGQMTLALQAPPFVNVARAAEAGPTTFDLGAYLDQEADISAYFHSADPINLNQVIPVFRTIEMTTTDFIIGSVQVGSYVEYYDVHVYVNTNGWILAYYLRDTPVSKIVSTSPFNINTSKLTGAIAKVAQAANAPFADADASYYNFRYPNATRMLFVYEDSDNGDDFTIQLTSSYTYYERSYIGWTDLPYGNNLRIDGVLPASVVCQGNPKCGYVSASELSEVNWHVVRVDRWGVLVIVYRE